jgi:hypothetical protein
MAATYSAPAVAPPRPTQRVPGPVHAAASGFWPVTLVMGRLMTWHWQCRLLCGLATAALAGGCPSTTGPGTLEVQGSSSSSAGSGGGLSFDAGIVSSRCLRDQDCGAGHVCGPGDAGCLAGVPCSVGSFVCGECGAGGTLNCGYEDATSYCDTAAATCRRTLSSCEPCTADEQCGENLQLGLANRCVDYGTDGRFCGLACAGTCSEGFVCEAMGACRVSATVGTCSGAIPCTGDEVCPDGQHCTTYAADPARQGVCLAFCLFDDDCPLGTICQTDPGASFGQCIQGCAPGSQVNEDRICHAWGRYGATCPTAACPVEYNCSASSDGYCEAAGCDADNECPLSRTYCDVGARTCVTGCQADDHCGAFEQCEGGTCVSQGCRGKDLSCNLGQFCCGTEVYAPLGEACPAGVETGECFVMPDPYCRGCDDDNACADIQRFGQASHCYELSRGTADGGSSPVGKFCSVGCQTDDDCPRGVPCLDLPAGQNGEMVKGCIDPMCAVFQPQ